MHKAERLDDILSALKQNSMGKIEVFLFYSKKGEVANRVVVRTVKSQRSPAVIYPPIVLHNDDGSYTERANEILLNGKSLFDI